MEAKVRKEAEIVWDYMLLHEPPRTADMLIVLGSNDERVAIRAAELTNEYEYGLVCFTGGMAHQNDLLKAPWRRSEAEHFQQLFERYGGAAWQTLLETRSQNTGENARLVHALLKEKGISEPSTIQIVTKPYMERRARATFEMQWPNKSATFFITSPTLSLDDYDNLKDVVNVLVGDFERIVTYPALGFQTPQTVPVNVCESWRYLVEAGYTRHMQKD